MSQRRVLDLDQGRAMVVTDLHGAGAVYRLLRDKFLKLREAGAVDRLIICGDLIHSSDSRSPDESLDMLCDVMRLQAELGPDAVVMLLGNHEMPHIYSVSLSKGAQMFTPDFEQALVELDQDSTVQYTRADVMRFLMSLPVYIRTKAGVMLSHAGAPEALSTLDQVEMLQSLDHAAILHLADDQLKSRYDLAGLRTNREYIGPARFLLAITGPDDPRLSHLLRGQLISQTSPEFTLLWDVLFARNEMASNLRTYSEVVTRFLKLFSEGSRWEQRVLLAGHIAAENGAEYIGMQKLRLASFAHAMPQHEGRYLLLDCAKSVQTAQDLEPHLHRVFES